MSSPIPSTSPATSPWSSLPTLSTSVLSHLSPDPTDPVHIVVVGCGLSSLSFCASLFALLHRYLPPASDLSSLLHITVLERDPSQNERAANGYSLSLRSDAIGGGIQILKKIGILDKLKESAAPGHSMRFSNGQWEDYFEFKTKDINPSHHGKESITIVDEDGDEVPGNIRIARKTLRDTLIEKCRDEGKAFDLRFNQHVTGIETKGDYEDGSDRIPMTIHIKDQASLTCNLLIGADGANSTIRRKLFPNVQLQYAGCYLYSGATTYPQGLPSYWRQGVVFALNDGVCYFVAPIDEKRLVFGVSERRPTPSNEYRGDRSPLTATQLQGFHRDVLDKVKGFGRQEEIKRMIQNCDPDTIRTINAQDMEYHYNSLHRRPQQRVLFIGDAAHAVSPFAGNGANMAIIDGYQLAELLVKCSDYHDCIRQYDHLSAPRCKRTQKISRFNITLLHSKGIAQFVTMNLFKLMGLFLFRPKTLGVATLGVLGGLIGIGWYYWGTKKPN